MEESNEKKVAGDIPTLHYMSAEGEKFKVIARFANEVEARMAAAKLDGEGIRAEVADQVVAAGLGGESAQLGVLVEDAAEAIEILKETPARGNLIGD